jgi:hypothetical protein
MAPRKTPAPKGPGGKFVPQVDAAIRREASARMRSRGVGWKEIADTHWNGDLRTASKQVKQWWADQPKETVEEIRATMLAKVDALEQEVRRVMAKRHYVVAEGRIVIDHITGCAARKGFPCDHGCPRLVDDRPIYEGVDRVRQLVETQLKLIPGLAAPKRMEVLTDDALAAEIERARADLAAESDGAPAGDVAGAAGTAEGEG